MALRDQPYIPLYVQDFETDEKLIYCSASATGVYIRIMCHMHKSERYGTILLKQNFKQTDKQYLNFAKQLAVILPYDLQTIESGLLELLNENVLIIDGDYLIQKRMVRDNEISVERAKAGSRGGKVTQSRNKNSKKKNISDIDFAKAKSKANTEYENEYEYYNKDNINLNSNNKKIEKKDVVKTEKDLEYERFNKWVDENAPYVRKIKNQITQAEYFRLTSIYTGDQIREILLSISNYKDAPKRYTSVNLTFRNWAKKEYGKIN